MNTNWLCATCMMRDSGFCAALLGTQSSVTRTEKQPTWQKFRHAAANENIIIRGDVAEFVHVLCDGWAVRYYPLADGRRQILSVLLAGDLFFPTAMFEDKINFSVQAVTESHVGLYKSSEVKEMLAVNPVITTALAKACVAQSNAADELSTVLGQRTAEERIAYLFLHIIKRLATRRVIREHRYPFPMRQQHIAEMIGLTPVHVSRVMTLFRERGLLDLSGGYLTVHNVNELEQIGSLK